MKPTITSITGQAILDSRGAPTLSITVEGSDGSTGTFAVPSGASTGAHEAHELRDDGTSHGGVDQALALLRSEIAPALIGKSLHAQEDVDSTLLTLDGTPNKERLGSNTLIGVSIALAKAAAASDKRETWQYLHHRYWDKKDVAFPRLYANLINGGKHAHTELAIQEYLVVPKTTDMSQAAAMVRKVKTRLGELIEKEGGLVQMGDEGGYALPVADIELPLALLQQAAEDVRVREEVDFALDVAASSLFEGGKGYTLGGTMYDVPGLTALYEKLHQKYALLSIEDPFAEDDFASFCELSSHLPGVLRVGDDLTTTNQNRLARAVEEGSIDAIIIKPNQIGTLTETIETMKLAEENGIKCIVSHRSGETMDDFIADLAYASGAFGIKLGAPGPREREAKYARLIAIEQAH